ncbi:GTPase IMAP family member 9-like [Salvelinus namaycush]|uniref:GTPase IMAP family member 9-like n=1 Tax=Salvelinus namaycush TaxID=8040 RepID=A0A8U0QJ22_SALNM|nr:GTPase IMAP family member 9-like [Salvelinus namaycush]
MELRILVVGSSGPSQFSLTNSILGREEFSKDVTSIVQSRKNLGDVAGTRVAVVNGPNLYGKHLSRTKMKTEMKRWPCKCLSAPGPHALLMAFDLEQICPNDVKTPKLMVKRFGEDALSHTIVLLAYEGDVDILALENRVSTDWHIRELIEQCGGRYHVFNKNWRDRSRDKELLQKIERMLATLDGQHYTSRSYGQAEESVRKEERKLLKKRAAETEEAWRELEQQYRGEALRWQMDAYNNSVGAEIRAKAEMDNGWLRTSLAVGAGLGLAAGAAMGMAMGAVAGATGMTVGGAFGGLMGGSAGGTAQVAIEHLEDRVGPHATNFNTVFINRFFRPPRS